MAAMEGRACLWPWAISVASMVRVAEPLLTARFERLVRGDSHPRDCAGLT